DGRLVRSRPLHLPATVVEDGATADYDAEDALVMTLPKQATVQVPAPPGNPEAAVRCRPVGRPALSRRVRYHHRGTVPRSGTSRGVRQGIWLSRPGRVAEEGWQPASQNVQESSSWRGRRWRRLPY